MVLDPRIPIDRVTYRDGQLLSSIDLRDDTGHFNRYRWLHTRFLHRSWGIVFGYTVRVTADQNAVRVLRGLALDFDGRELLLSENVTVALPKDASSAVLVIRYQLDSEVTRHRDNEAICIPGKKHSRIEQPVFSWQHPDDARFGQYVPLAFVRIAGDAVVDVDDRVRPYARKMVRPRLGSGITEPGRTGWRFWFDDESETALGIEVAVDTSSAGFTDTPAYFPILHADIHAQAGRLIKDMADSEAGSQPVSVVPERTCFVSQAGADSFLLRLLVTDEITPTVAEDREWHVGWFGLEPAGGCEPAKLVTPKIKWAITDGMVVSRF